VRIGLVAPPHFLQIFSPRGRRFASALFPPATAELALHLFFFARRFWRGAFYRAAAQAASREIRKQNARELRPSEQRAYRKLARESGSNIRRFRPFCG
jgi:hypothetical protein